MEIERRLTGMQTLTIGSKAPSISMKDAEGKDFDLDSFNPGNRYIFLLFWSADCSHCVETVDAIYPWYQDAAVQQKMSVVAISLDETETEVRAWRQKMDGLKSWKHLRASEGVRSKVASDYFVLATPVMILIDPKTKEIVAFPSTFNELKSILP